MADPEERALASRLVNLEIRSMISERRDLPVTDEWEFLCECGSCHEHAQLAAADFDQLLAADELVLAPDHLFAAARRAREVARRLRRESEAVRGQAAQAQRQAHRFLADS